MTLRLAAVRAVRRKFARLKGLLVRLVVGEDAFGLAERRPYRVVNWCNQYGGDTCSTGEKRQSLTERGVQKVRDAYAKFSKRYGPKSAVAIIAAMAVTMPLPGNIFAVLGIAEGVRYATLKLTGNESYGIDDSVLDDVRLLSGELGLTFDPLVFSQEYLRQLRSPVANVDRIDMPQIRKEHWQRFLAYARERTSLTEESGIDPKTLKGVQDEFSQERVDAIPVEKLQWPILVSKDGYVLDGNHRWIKAYQLGHPVKVLRLGLDVNDSLAMMREFPQAEFVGNSFCPTGPGGGVDPSCSPATSKMPTEGGFVRSGSTGETVEYHVNPSHAKLRRLFREDPEGVRGLASDDRVIVWKASSALHNEVKEGLGLWSEKPAHFEIEPHTPGSAMERPGNARLQVHGLKPEGWVERHPYFSKFEMGKDKFFNTHITVNRFQFHSSPDKVAEFQKWLRLQFKSTLLGKSDEELWAEFAKRGYEKGAGRAFDDVNKARRWLPGEGEFYGRSRQEFLRSSFGRAESVDKLQLLAGRSFTDLRNVTEDMATRMSRTLMDGLSWGANPRDLVDQLVDDLEVSEGRAETIARSEIIRAHSEGQLDAMEKLGVEEVGVAVEWDTAKDGRVCRHCQPLQGVVLTVQEAHGLIPQHPNCRCAFVPANVGEDDSKQIRSKQEILDAFEEAEVEPPELDDERPQPLVEPTKNELYEFSRLIRS